MNNTVTVPIECWGANTTLDLRGCPDDWPVTHCTMKGHDTPGITDEKIQTAFDHPYGTLPLREMAKGKKRIVILFDDLIRPTPAYRAVPFIIDELHRGGIDDDQIRFVAAIGTHGPMTRADFVKKLGENKESNHEIGIICLGRMGRA